MATAAKRTKTIIARRQDLITGTIKSIATIGYHNSTVQTICEAAGLSRGLIGHYFKGKDDLLLEAFRHQTAEADEDTKQAIRAVGTDPVQRLLAATSVTFMRSATSREHALVWLAFCGVVPWNSSMGELHAKLYRRYRSWIQRMMEQAAEERGIEIDAKRAALTYAQMVDGFWMGWIMDGEAYSLDEATEIVSDWVLNLFGEKPTSKRKATAIKAATDSVQGRIAKAAAEIDNDKQIAESADAAPSSATSTAERAKPRRKPTRT
ncbi:TetR family transcriptional regulator C-terminal domain-containing protein [Dongia soli]|uniref:TetR family transcriptional regulator C-terminal domain-containing protein n=1 Tax=Dongia soli TaxID=600628 RepID=A0ABU5EBP7_9PROT|nr:TetR family transcriptional regulator C-terminal domain-containing protein [Dongia soli]MDY0883771.1 TetR family transcriptional regulator C-terminal domain-containing protein [Dongia soli]